MQQTTRYLALAGVVTGAAGVVTSQATAWLLRADNPPVSAVASAVRDLTPGGLAHWLIDRVGDRDKPLLIAGTVLILLTLCAWVGVVTRRRPLLADLVYVALAVVGLLSVRRLDDSTIGSIFAVLVGFMTWVVVNRLLTAPLLARSDDRSEDGSEVGSGRSRRAFLLRAGGVVVAVLGAGIVGRISSRRRHDVEQSRKLLRLSGKPGAVPAGARVDVPGVARWRTPNKTFYKIDTTFAPPLIRPSEWELRVHGLVENELVLTYEDLAKRRATGAWITLCCVSNEVGGDLIGNAWWTGVLARDVLAEAKPLPGADAVLQTSQDGWTCATPLAALTDDRNAMLALEMNGEALPIDHGYPVRMVVPGLYGYVSATKWLVDLEVTRFDEVTAYWTKRGWSERGPVKTQSRIDVPRDGNDVDAGTLAVGGVAWAQHTGIERVEFQLDGGPWRSARLGAVPNLDTWVQWAGEVTVAEGTHTLVVRATDRSGYTQTAVQTDVIPDGATGWHSVTFDAR